MSYVSNELTVIIVLFEENDDLVITCLKNIQNFRVIIVDNANNYNLKKKIEKKFDIQNYILNPKNVGFTKAANQAIKLCKTEYILNINADCLIEEKGILKLLDCRKNYKDCFITAPTFYDDNFNLAYNADYFEEKNISKKILNLEGDICVDQVLGSAFLFKKKDIEDINFLDENFFMYFEDSYLCQIAKRKKKSVIQVFDVKVKHIHGKSKVKNIFKRTFIRHYHFTFDQLYYYYKIGLEDEKYNYLKKKIINYFIKMILNLIILRLNKSVHYFSLIKAFYDFNRLINSIKKKN
jgi:N-acetylglucosaminyl-diphospho-decaprenol L-rhamnosyltransferase